MTGHDTCSMFQNLTCKPLNPLTGVLIALFSDDIVDICVNGITFNCNGESSGLLVGVTANVPTQLPLIDEFDSDEFDSDNEFRRPYISGTFIDSPRDTKINRHIWLKHHFYYESIHVAN